MRFLSLIPALLLMHRLNSEASEISRELALKRIETCWKRITPGMHHEIHQRSKEPPPDEEEAEAAEVLGMGWTPFDPVCELSHLLSRAAIEHHIAR